MALNSELDVRLKEEASILYLIVLMKPFLSAIINLCQTLLKEDGTPRNTLPNK